MCDTQTIIDGYKDRHNMTRVAMAMGIKHPTLMRKLNQYDEDRELRASEIIPFLTATDDLSLLDAWEAHFDRVAIPLHPDKCHDIISLSKEAGEALTTYASALEDGKIDKSEAAKCVKELTELAQVCLGIVAQCHAILAGE